MYKLCFSRWPSHMTCVRSCIAQSCFQRHNPSLCFKTRSFGASSHHGHIYPWYTRSQLVVVGRFLPQHLCKIPCVNKSLSPVDLAKDIAAIKRVDEYLYLYDEFKTSTGMTQVNRITILHNIAKFSAQGSKQNFTSTKKTLKEQQQVFGHLINSIAAGLEKCKPRDLSSIIWALGKISHNVTWFVAECEKEVLRRDVNSFRVPAVCQILNGLASLGFHRSRFFFQVEQQILKGGLKLKDFESRSLAGVLWSYTKTANGSKELFETLQEEILSRGSKAFSGHQLAQFLWSFTKKEMNCDQFFDITEQEILKNNMFSSLADHTIKMLLWSYAKNGKGSLELWESLGSEVLERGVHDFDTGELALLVWAYAKQCPKMDSIFDLVEEEFNLREIMHFRNHELCLMLWSFAECRYFRNELFQACQEEILSRDLSLFKTSQLSQLTWAFGRAKIPSTELFSRIEVVLKKSIATFSDMELCMIARGFSQASAGTQELYNLLEKEIIDRNLLTNKPDFIPELLWVFSNCSYNATRLFEAAERKLPHLGLSAYQGHELQTLKASFQKVGRTWPVNASTATRDGHIVSKNATETQLALK